jgi:hypothetical protein
MSTTPRPVRLRILLEPAGLLRVLDRLSVLGLVPHRLLFRSRDVHESTLWLELDPLDVEACRTLTARIEQIPTVASVISNII